VTIPKRYLSGLSPEERKRRIDEIKRGRKTSTSDKSAYSSSRFTTDAGKKTKPSKYTQRGKKLLGNSNAKTLDAKLAVLSKKTGYSVGTLRQVYNRGLAAWRTGHRPGATQHAWAMARVYSFVTGGKTAQTADKDLKQRGMKEAVAFKRGLRLAKSALGGASGAASFGTVMRKGQSVRIKRDLGGAGGGQFVSFQVAQADNLKKSVVVARRVARMRGKPAPEVPDYRVTTSSRVPSPEELMDQLRDGLQKSRDTQAERDATPLWKKTTSLEGGPQWTSYEDDEPWGDDEIVKQGIDRIKQEYDVSMADAMAFPAGPERDEALIRGKLASTRVGAMMRYTDTGYEKINADELRLNNGTIDEGSQLHADFKEAFDALSVSVPYDHSVFRGGGSGWTEAVLDRQYGNFRFGSLEDFRSLVGHTFRTDSWTSTSRASWMAGSSNFGLTKLVDTVPGKEPIEVMFIFRMHRKAGSRGLFVEDASASGKDEHEVILPPQEKYVVRGFTLAGNHPALLDEDGFSYDFRTALGITDEYDDIFTIDDDIDIEDPKDIADGGGSKSRKPFVIIDVEQI
jgi:hypothetical protein